MRATCSKLVVVSAVFLLGACGDGSPPAADCDALGRYLPMATGASWTYQVTDATTGAIETKTSSVGALEDVGGQKAGVMAFRVTTERAGGMTVSWQEDTGSAIVRHKELDMAGATMTEEWYAPSKLRLDESQDRLVPGATFTTTHTEMVIEVGAGTTTASKTEQWTVEAVDETVVVPAGAFCAVRIRRDVAATGSSKTYWFARGVGKVRESGSNQTEELAAFTIP